MIDKKKKVDAKKIVKKTVNKATHPVLFPTAKFGDKASDWLTNSVGSWSFIISFLVFLGLWMIVNVYAWVNVWDPYPFILLNLVLSCLAAIQAPIIMMSQNRAAQKDRQRAEYDYAVNRKSAREIENLKKQLNRIERKLGQ